ncbi:MAG: PAS domain-containing protein [Pirellulales bacterium]
MAADITPLNVESPFRIEELFFSTTDSKGIIESGNTVFSRVSGYQYEKMVGKPHNLIRHPDMPRTVFKLLWDYLHAKKPIVAYVKNLAINGHYYWVLALVTPLNDGYLSVRFKPSSPLFPVVEEIYKELRSIETCFGDFGTQRQDGMRVATERLVEILQSHGYENYDQFMAEVLRVELKSRDAILSELGLTSIPSNAYCGTSELGLTLSSVFVEGQALNANTMRLFERIDDFIGLSEQLEKDATFVLSLAHSLQLISLNASVESAKIRGCVPSLGVIAEHLGQTSREVTVQVNLLREQIHKLIPELSKIGFGLAASRLQVEMLTSFSAEFIDRLNSAGQATDSLYMRHATPMIKSLQTAFRQTFHQVASELEAVERPLLDLGNASEELRKTILTLSFSQLVGTVEATALGSSSNFSVIFDEIKGQISNAKDQLINLNRSVSTIYDRLQALPEVTSTCSDQLNNIGKLFTHSARPDMPDDYSLHTSSELLA